MSHDEVVAIISAAIAAMNSNPECKLVVKSFRRIPQKGYAWASAGILENTGVLR